ncbi:MAG: hypothetical protein ACNA7Q_12675 [Rhodobacterales bacterium]
MSDILALRLESYRVSAMREEPDTIVITIRANDTDHHFLVDRDGFAGPARQIGIDAKLLSADQKKASGAVS